MPDRHGSTMVRVVNEGDRPFRGTYDRVDYVLAPGEDDRLISWDAMVFFAGDPDSQNIGERDSEQHRLQQQKRLSVQYGVYSDSWYNDEPGAHTPPKADKLADGNPIPTAAYIDGRHPNLPRLAFYSLEDGSRFNTVLDDPEGTRLTKESSVLTDPRSLERQVKTLTDSVSRVLEELRSVSPEAADRAAAALTSKPTAPQVIMPDTGEEIDFPTEEYQGPVGGNALEEVPVEDVPATEDLPPGARPSVAARKKAAAAANRGE